MLETSLQQYEHKINFMLKLVDGLIRNNVNSVIISGNPGIGKTWNIIKKLEQLSEELDIRFNKFSGSITPLAFYQQLSDYSTNKDILFFDEITTCSISTQKALLRIILDRQIGDYKLPKNVSIIAAGNYINVLGNNRMSIALSNRFLHIYYKVDIQSWIEGTLQGFGIPTLDNIDNNWSNNIPLYTSIVTGFISRNPTSLMKLPEDDADDYSQSWGSPRSWTGAIKVLAITHNMNIDVRKELLSGIIGIENANIFINYLKEIDLIDFTTLDISNYKLPENRPDIVDVLLKSAVYYSDKKDLTDKSIEIFKLCYNSGYGSLVMNNIKSISMKIAPIVGVDRVLKEFPFVPQILGKVKA